MKFDIFFSICQTPVRGFCPSEKEMFQNFFSQVEAADRLGFETAWVAESHFSSEVQKTHKKPVVPHWKGEIGLNTDIYQLAHQIFHRTENIEVGSAVMNIVCNGGPIAAAERAATFLTLHGLKRGERRRLHIGFSAGRFDFMNRTTGVVARTALEEKFWPVIKGKIFSEASEIFVRLLSGETIRSEDIPQPYLSSADFRTTDDWSEAQGHVSQPTIALPRRWEFEKVKLVPQEFQRDLLQLVVGSHDPATQEYVNRFAPVQVFNLSITKPDIIEDTHRRLSKSYHPSGGPWKREYMPRTVFVFINEQSGLTDSQKSSAAREEATLALSEYWNALEGTLDRKKIEEASDNALVGNADDITKQILERFHPDDRLMLWFDFFNHDNERVISNMEAFHTKVIPKIQGTLHA